MKTPKLVLASTSPRRRFLLKQVGIRFDLKKPNAEEFQKKGELPKAMVRRLSEEKGLSVAKRLKSGKRIVLAADTIVVQKNGRTVLGKPRNRAEAYQMLRMISGRVHTVYTGYSLFEVDKGIIQKKLTRVVGTKVRIRKLTPELIRRYISRGESMDKAGAYAAQGYGMGLVEKIVGSYSNVVGLPVCEILNDLEKKFGVPSFK